jgi:hypothetical protein
MLSLTNSTVRVERVIQECMMRHQVSSHLWIRLAYKRVFVDALRQVPRQHLPEDVLQIALTVRALEYASFAAFIEHATGEKVAFHGGAAWEVLDWLDECCKFWYEILHQWEDLAITQRAEERKSLLQSTVDWLRGAVEDVREHGIVEDKPLCLMTSWFKQVEGTCIMIAKLWMDEAPAAALEERLDQDADVLQGIQFLYNQSDKDKAKLV